MKSQHAHNQPPTRKPNGQVAFGQFVVASDATVTRKRNGRVPPSIIVPETPQKPKRQKLDLETYEEVVCGTPPRDDLQTVPESPNRTLNDSEDSELNGTQEVRSVTLRLSLFHSHFLSFFRDILVGLITSFRNQVCPF
jgi:hypothetical protein